MDLGPIGIGAGNTPAFTLRQMVERDHPVASMTAGKRRNFLVVVMIYSFDLSTATAAGSHAGSPCYFQQRHPFAYLLFRETALTVQAIRHRPK